jgi:hypothetical protein
LFSGLVSAEIFPGIRTLKVGRKALYPTELKGTSLQALAYYYYYIRMHEAGKFKLKYVMQ